MMKVDLISQTDLPVFPFSAEDYRDICSEKTEEKRRHVLCEILAKKTLEYRNMENKDLGKVLKQKNNPQEPVLPAVADKDREMGGIAVDRLQSLIERIERLESDKNGIASDIRDIYAEAKSAGFDTKIMRMIIKLRKMNVADRDEQEFLLDTYRKALGI